jgi:hypothetical protein
LELSAGIEPALQPYKGCVIPLYDDSSIASEQRGHVNPHVEAFDLAPVAGAFGNLYPKLLQACCRYTNAGVEPVFPVGVLPLHQDPESNRSACLLERPTGFEPVPQGLEGPLLPLTPKTLNLSTVESSLP